jgi:uncharacterized protein (TIGR00730 family)
MRRICIFAGSNAGSRPEYAAAASELGEALASRGIGVVYGGGNVGLMGVLADAALRRGGSVIGVIPEALVRKEVAHTGLTELRVVHSMHERKALMSELSDAFIALPGGLGTFEELFEVVTWAQLGIHAKPCGLLNVKGYYDGLLSFVRHAVVEEFLHPRHAALLLASDSLADLLTQMEEWRPPPIEKWLDRNET